MPATMPSSSAGTFPPLFGDVALHRVSSTLADAGAIPVHPAHARLGSERHKVRVLLITQFPASQAVLLLRQHDDAAPLGRLVGKG